MGFLNPLKTIGKGLSKLPGAKAFNKPINKALGKSKLLRGAPAALGMKPKSPIAPSVGAVNRGVAGSMKNAGVAGPPPMSGPPPMQPPMNQPPPVMQPQQMDLSPMQAPPPMQQPQPMEQASLTGDMGGMAAPQQMPNLQGWGQPQQAPPMMNPNGPLMDSLQNRNSGVVRPPIGRRPSGIGPRFMG